MSLTRRALKSGFWISALKVSLRGMGFLRLVILARLLGPKDFGIMAVVMLSIDFLYQFSQMAVGMALVQKKGDIEDYLGTAWIMGVSRGCLIFAILYWAAPALASFFNNAHADQYIRVAAFSPLILAFASIRMIMVGRELQFDKKFVHEVIGTVVDMIVSITLAFMWRNVWALIGGLLAGNAVRVLVSYIIFPGEFKFDFDRSKASEIFHFGKWVFLNQVLKFVSGRMGDVMIGKLISVTTLGYYQMALRVASLIPGELSSVLTQVLFPAYSKIRDDQTRFRQAIFRVGQLNSILGLPMAALTCYFAPDIVHHILGDAWTPAVPLMQILAVNTLFDYMGSSFGPVLLSLGKTGLIFRLQVYRICVLLPAMYVLTSKYGAIGTAWSLIVAQVLVAPVSRTIVFRLLGCSIMDYFKWIKDAMMASVGMVAVLLLVEAIIPGERHSMIEATALFLFALGSYYGFLFFLLSQSKSELVNHLSWNGLRKTLLGRA